jgi:hypothetical protein
MSRSRVFVTPPALSVPPNSAFKAYLINTNGLCPARCPPLSEGTDPVKLNKIKLLRDLANRWRLDAIHLTETHDQNPVALGPLKEWHFTPSTPVGGIHGTATLTSLPPNDTRVDTNVSTTCISWENQPIWLVTAYFPNELRDAKATVSRLKKILSGLKSKRVILAGDFNSTETLSSFDTGGPLPPSHAKESNAQALQTLLDEWRFKDLWTRESNDSRESERNSLEHLTHWNNDHTRGHRTDRVYANFAIEAEVTVTTFHHPGSDHRGVLYTWSARAPLTEEPPSPRYHTGPLSSRRLLPTTRLSFWITQKTTWKAQTPSPSGTKLST